MKNIHTENAPAAVGPYSQAVRVGDWLYLSAQVALDPATGVLVEGSVTTQTHQVMKNVGAVLQAAGGKYAHLVKTTLYLVDLTHFAEVNEVYAHYVQTPYPARATLGVAALPKGSWVALDGVAWLGS
ncbi:MAG: RidA family protein [Magnetococcales bacterium]|nr:RidA family protein [Magnetococcales bacterium]